MKHQTGRQTLALAPRQTRVPPPPAVTLTAQDAANYRKAVRLYRDRDLPKARRIVERLVKRLPDSMDVLNLYSAILFDQKDFAAAVAILRRIEARGGGNALVLNNLGSALRELGDLDAAAPILERALVVQPDLPEAHYNYGRIKLAQGALDDAVAHATVAIRARPDYADACALLGLALQGQGDGDGAQTALQMALTLDPAHREAARALVTALVDDDRTEEAIVVAAQATQKDPDNAAIFLDLVDLLTAAKQEDKIELALLSAKAFAPDHGLSHVQLALHYYGLYRFEEAIAEYGLALRKTPRLAGWVHNLIALCQSRLENDAATVSHFRKALRHAPDSFTTLFNYGGYCYQQRRYAQAAQIFGKALAIRPDSEPVIIQRIHSERYLCDWSNWDADSRRIPELGFADDALSPFHMLSMDDDAGRQFRRARTWARKAYGRIDPLPGLRPAAHADRIHLGFFSADFHSFPGMFLMIGLLERIDRSRFEVTAFSMGPDMPHDPMRQRIVRGVDRFVDIRRLGDRAIVDLAREMRVDIALNRNGYTRDGRNEIYAHRVAPVQVNYLGYPGTLGADFADYMIVDDMVAPARNREFFSERLIHMPDSYQPNDDTRPVPDMGSTRADHGLPADALVLCCFNNSYKIGPDAFDIWCRVLQRNPGTVLWLLGDPPELQDNLRAEARARGVSPDRLVFAPRIGPLHHLERHRHADLFVDTFCYNAHTTASDALWMGLPVVTRAGDQFAARVGASLLRSVGLPELITETEFDYEALIDELVNDPDRLRGLRARLQAQARTSALFDTARYVRNFETAMERIWDRAVQGLPPQDMRL